MRAGTDRGRDQRGDPLRRAAVAVRRAALGHGAIDLGVREQARDLRDDAVGIGANQLGDPELDGLGPLRHLAQDKDRLAERGRLLLEATAIGENQRAALYRRDEVRVAERLGDRDLGVAAEDGVRNLPDVGVRVHRIQHAQVRKRRAEAPDRLEHLRRRRAEALPAVHGHQDQSPVPR